MNGNDAGAATGASSPNLSKSKAADLGKPEAKDSQRLDWLDAEMNLILRTHQSNGHFLHELSRDGFTLGEHPDLREAIDAAMGTASLGKPEAGADIAQFLKEFNEGKHPLSPEDEAALERTKPELFRKLKLIFGKPEAETKWTPIRWTVHRYDADAWKVMEGDRLIMDDLTKVAAEDLADNHNAVLKPEAEKALEVKEAVSDHAQAVLQKCVEALLPFHRLALVFNAEPYKRNYPDDLRLRDSNVVESNNFLTLGDCRRAMVALKTVERFLSHPNVAGVEEAEEQQFNCEPKATQAEDSGGTEPENNVKLN